VRTPAIKYVLFTFILVSFAVVRSALETRGYKALYKFSRLLLLTMNIDDIIVIVDTSGSKISLSYRC